ncbi:hypothetical protein F5Y07DRAFT_296333 [Xylaria sp. FL0933]|nr:hypothetical protein F5Y07DRAFT_296333 [Xylaria sp. FL0933]
MSVAFRAGARLRSVGHLCKSSAATQTCHQNIQKPAVRHISWMPFEQPDPTLYPPPPSLQPKRPVTTNSTPSDDATVSQTATIGKLGTAPSASRGQEDPASSKPVPTSVPASAMQTGPTPLSQIQKRSFNTITTTAALAQRRKRLDSEAERQEQRNEKGGREEDGLFQPTTSTEGSAPAQGKPGEKAPTPATKLPTKEDDSSSIPTFFLRIPGRPSTWPDNAGGR